MISSHFFKKYFSLQFFPTPPPTAQEVVAMLHLPASDVVDAAIASVASQRAASKRNCTPPLFDCFPTLLTPPPPQGPALLPSSGWATFLRRWIR
jgi:hypothetical protein